ncbi:MAG: hypothetical protein M3220_01895 [Chloroflexota bacterium]|nr:hypothetical protein [Chloroflexota bacterium]
MTESCDDDLPHLLTNVETTLATTTDYEMTPVIHEHLAAREVLPSEHLLDSGYVTADNLVNSRTDHQVALLGPVLEENSWQPTSLHRLGHKYPPAGRLVRRGPTRSDRKSPFAK